MRQLTKSQKTLLTKWVNANPNINFHNDLSAQQWDMLVRINDTEILWNEVDRFIHDYKWSEAYRARAPRFGWM